MASKATYCAVIRVYYSSSCENPSLISRYRYHNYPECNEQSCRDWGWLGLRALDAFPEFVGLIPSTHIKWLSTNYSPSSKGSVLSSDLCGPCTYMLHRHTWRYNTHIHKIKANSKKSYFFYWNLEDFKTRCCIFIVFDLVILFLGEYEAASVPSHCQH